MSVQLIIALSVIAIILLIFIGIYNMLISRKNQVEYANGSIDVMYKQRHDLIPNLVAVVKQYMQYEKDLLLQLTNLRTKGESSTNTTAQERSSIDRQFDQVLNSFHVAVENYPNLKANEQFLRLQASLNECEGQLAAARRTYNAAVMDFNNALEMFPSSMVASLMKYKRKDMIFINDTDKEVPQFNSL